MKCRLRPSLTPGGGRGPPCKRLRSTPCQGLPIVPPPGHSWCDRTLSPSTVWDGLALWPHKKQRGPLSLGEVLFLPKAGPSVSVKEQSEGSGQMKPRWPRPPEDVGRMWPVTHMAPSTGAGIPWDQEPTGPEGRGQGGAHKVGRALDKFRLAEERGPGHLPPGGREGWAEMQCLVRGFTGWKWGVECKDEAGHGAAGWSRQPGFFAPRVTGPLPCIRNVHRDHRSSPRKAGVLSLGGRVEEGGADPRILGRLGNGSSPSPISTPLREGWWLFRPERVAWCHRGWSPSLLW